MRKPITSYHMNLYSLANPEINFYEPKITLTFKKITEDNLEEVAALRGFTRLREFKKMLKQNCCLGIAAYSNEEIVGYGWLKYKGCYDKFYNIKNNIGYLSSFYVTPDYRGYSIYPAIISYLILNSKYIQIFKISIDKRNKSSINGALKIGFKYEESHTQYRILKVTVPKLNL